MERYYVGEKADLVRDGKAIKVIKGIEIGLFHVKGTIYAWRNLCPHAAAPVCRGKVTGTRLPSQVYEYEYGCDQQILRCPWHGWEFDLITGTHLADPHVRLRGYEIVVEGESVYLIM
jgi:nitrite reductase (NADH) small subunit